MLLTTNRTFNNKCNWCYTFKCKDKVMKYEDIKKYVNELKKLGRKNKMIKKRVVSEKYFTTFFYN